MGLAEDGFDVAIAYRSSQAAAQDTAATIEAMGEAGPFYPDAWPEPELGWSIWSPEPQLGLKRKL